MPIDLFIYIVIAIVLVVWLRNVIGSKHGSELDRSDIIDRLQERQNQQKTDTQHTDKNADSGHIIDLSLPANGADATFTPSSLSEIAIEGGADTAKEIIEYMRVDQTFDPKSFIEGAKEAFPMIVESFAKEDLKTLKMLLSDGVYSTFEQAIDDRKSKGETLITDVHVVKNCKIMGIKKIDRMAYIKLRFIADESITIRDREGNIIHGNPDKIITMNDVWTFGRDSRSKDPTWYLYETSDDVPEELKNPIPDAK